MISSQTSVSWRMILERLQHRCEMTARHLPVEAFGERLQIDVRGVHVREELTAWGRRRRIPRSPRPDERRVRGTLSRRRWRIRGR